MKKRCSACRRVKVLSKFYKDKSRLSGYDARCKNCDYDKTKKYRNNNRKKFREQRRAFYKRHPDKMSIYYDRYYDRRLSYHKMYIKKRSLVDPNFKLGLLLRSRLYNALKGNRRTGSAVRDLGCSLDFLRNYLKKQFKPGMSWSNHGKWHIDHIIPLTLFDLTDRKELLKACHYTNLRPLWARENLKRPKRREDIEKELKKLRIT